MGFDDLIAPLAAERGDHAAELLRAWLAEPERDAARQRFLALKDEWQYLAAGQRDELLAEARDGLPGVPDEPIKAVALELLDQPLG